MADFWLAAYFVFDCSGLDNKAKCLAFLRGWPFALFSQEFLNHTNYSKLFCLLLGLLVVVWPSLFFLSVIQIAPVIAGYPIFTLVFAGHGGCIIFLKLSFLKQ